MLIIGIVLWAVGASQGSASMILAGQILFGLGVAPLGIALLAIGCYCCCAGCFHVFGVNTK